MMQLPAKTGLFLYRTCRTIKSMLLLMVNYRFGWKTNYSTIRMDCGLKTDNFISEPGNYLRRTSRQKKSGFCWSNVVVLMDLKSLKTVILFIQTGKEGFLSPMEKNQSSCWIQLANKIRLTLILYLAKTYFWFLLFQETALTLIHLNNEKTIHCSKNAGSGQA